MRVMYGCGRNVGCQGMGAGWDDDDGDDGWYGCDGVDECDGATVMTVMGRYAGTMTTGDDGAGCGVMRCRRWSRARDGRRWGGWAGGRVRVRVRAQLTGYVNGDGCVCVNVSGQLVYDVVRGGCDNDDWCGSCEDVWVMSTGACASMGATGDDVSGAGLRVSRWECRVGLCRLDGRWDGVTGAGDDDVCGRVTACMTGGECGYAGDGYDDVRDDVCSGHDDDDACQHVKWLRYVRWVVPTGGRAATGAVR